MGNPLAISIEDFILGVIASNSSIQALHLLPSEQVLLIKISLVIFVNSSIQIEFLESLAAWAEIDGWTVASTECFVSVLPQLGEHQK
jgi:hypothetical protein